MFVALPLFLAVGFSIGFACGSAPLHAWWLFRSASERLLIALGVITVLLICPGIFGSYVEEITPRGVMIAAGGVVVGLATGYWFATHEGENKERDQLIFLAAAGLLVLLTALEYDTKLFDHLTKFGAGSVDLEFDGAKDTPSASKRRPEPNLTRTEFGSFPGAYRLDKAISYLSQIGAWVLRDEQYSRLFSGVGSTPVDFESFSESLSPDSRAFAEFGCRDLEYVTAELTFLQNNFRGESALTMDESKLALDLRSLRSRVEHGQPLDIDTVAGDFRAIAQMTEDEIGFEAAAGGEADGLAKLFKGLRAWKAYTCNMFADWGHFVPGAVESNAWGSISQHLTPNSYVTLGYLTIVTSLIEFAVGNGEGAVQLLDREIERQAEWIKKNKEAFAAEVYDCGGLAAADCANRKKSQDDRRLDAYRRLVTLLRLENVQDSILDFWTVGSISHVRVHGLERMDSGYTAALTRVRGKLASGVSPECPGLVKEGPTAERLLVLWSFAQIVAQANQLEMAAFEPQIVRLEPMLRARLDKLADHVVAYDAQCAYDKDVAASVAETTVELLSSAAEYWEAEGANFGDPTGADEPGVIGGEITALCRARKTFVQAEKAAEALKNPASDSPDPGPTDLDLWHAGFIKDSKLLTIQDALKRISGALKSFPAGDLDKYCPS